MYRSVLQVDTVPSVLCTQDQKQKSKLLVVIVFIRLGADLVIPSVPLAVESLSMLISLRTVPYTELHCLYSKEVNTRGWWLVPIIVGDTQ